MNEKQLQDYLDRNYGTCKLDTCLCRSTVKPRFGGEWVGKLCPDWVPTGAKNWEELRQHLMEKKNDDRSLG